MRSQQDTGSASIPPEERLRRFWQAHGRSRDHLTALHAMSTNPDFAWTPEHLLIWYGIDLARGRAILSELAECKITRPVGRRAYAWAPQLAWVAEGGASGWRRFQERWAEIA